MKKACTVILCLLAAQAPAQDGSWPDLRAQLYDDAFLMLAGDTIRIDAPYRSAEDARTDIGAQVSAPPGQLLDSVTVILDENPMPVSAVFQFAQPVADFDFDMTMRVNGPTPLHVVTRTQQGQMLVANGFVKTSGQGACAAPPGTDPELALATLGQMAIALPALAAGDLLATLPKATSRRPMRIEISHPSHSGMQMNQISLLYIPARFIDTIVVDLDGQPYVTITGSISLSENPQITLSIPANARVADVTMTDTSGARSTVQALLQGS